MPSKFELFLALAWAKIKGAGKWILTALLAIALLIVGLVAVNKNKDEDKTVNNRPEVAQVYEPSISTPLPADTTPSNNSSSTSEGQVAGASTSTPSTDDSASRPTPVSESVMAPAFTAPKTGVDPNESIKYENSELKFKASLPAQSQVVENNNSINFYSKAGTLLYSVTVVNSSDSLDLIMRQLKASPEVSKLAMNNFSGNPAIKFSTYTQTGYVISKNNKVYYILGDPKYLTDISI